MLLVTETSRIRKINQVLVFSLMCQSTFTLCQQGIFGAKVPQTQRVHFLNFLDSHIKIIDHLSQDSEGDVTNCSKHSWLMIEAFRLENVEGISFGTCGPSVNTCV